MFDSADPLPPSRPAAAASASWVSWSISWYCRLMPLLEDVVVAKVEPSRK